MRQHQAKNAVPATSHGHRRGTATKGVAKLFLGIVSSFMLWGMAEAGRLGVALQDGSETGQPGATVMAVSPDSPAALAGMQAGDVIMSVQGRFVVAAQQVVEAMQSLPAGSSVQLELLRFGQRVPLTVVLAADAGAVAAAPAPSPRAATAPARSVGARAVAPASGVPLSVQQTQHCSALTPAGWSLQSNPQASTLEALSPDRSMYAGWGVTSIDRSMEPYYGPMYGDPDTSIQYMVNQILGSLGDAGGMRYTGAPESFLNNYFTLRRFDSAANTGLVFYKVYPGYTYPQTYIESFYVAIANKAQAGAALPVAGGVAVSIRCQTQLIPVRYDPPGRGKGGNSPRGCGYGGELKGYNKELGWQYAHSASTGENFLLDAATQWQENGPQGAGYYRSSGNSYEKLELGRDDDC